VQYAEQRLDFSVIDQADGISLNEHGTVFRSRTLGSLGYP